DGSSETWPVPRPLVKSPEGMYVLNWKVICINSQSMSMALVPILISPKPDWGQQVAGPAGPPPGVAIPIPTADAGAVVGSMCIYGTSTNRPAPPAAASM